MSSTLHMWTIGNDRTASTRLRILQYLPLLKRDGIRPRVRTIPNGFVPRLLLKAALRRGDRLLIQKKLFALGDVGRLRNRAARLLFDFDDAIHLDGPGSDRNRIRFRAVTGAADRVIAGNPNLAEACPGRPVTVLPTPIDTERFKPVPAGERDSNLMAWIGSRTNLGNLDLIFGAFERASSSRPKLRLVVMADRPPVEAPPGVQFEEWSPENERALLGRATYGLMPLIDTPFNRGKCGFKILLYQAAGLCVLASPVGINRGLVQDGEDGFLAGPEGWDSAFERALEDSRDAIRLGESGRARVERTHSVSVLYPRFRDLIVETV